MELSELDKPKGFTISINGTSVTLAEASTDALREALRAHGIVTFAAVVDGMEVSDPAALIEAIAEGQNVEVRTYAKPGGDATYYRARYYR